jgi:hypothetical protein
MRDRAAGEPWLLEADRHRENRLAPAFQLERSLNVDSSGLCQRRKHVPGGSCLLIDPFVSLPIASPWWNRSGIVIVSYQVPSSEFADNLSLPGRDRMDNLLKAHT